MSKIAMLSCQPPSHDYTLISSATASAPAATLLGIQSLYASEAAIEVEGVAVVR